MFQSIYSKPLLSIILSIAIAVVVWGYLRTKVQLRRWTMANFVLFCAAVIAILYATILTRTPGNYELILTPLRRAFRCPAAAGTLPRDADERLPFLSAGADAVQCAAAEVAPLA